MTNNVEENSFKYPINMHRLHTENWIYISDQKKKKRRRNKKN